MAIALCLLAIQGAIGAFDTVYYHEWRARLPARGNIAAPELRIHAVRDFLYAVIFGTLPWIAWRGLFTVVLGLILVAEIVLTLADFVTEARVRKSFGDVYPGERVTHAVMGIIYGAMTATMLPTLASWWSAPTALDVALPVIPDALRWVLSLMAVGVFLSGVRDLYAAGGRSHGAWPWTLRESARADRAP